MEFKEQYNIYLEKIEDKIKEQFKPTDILQKSVFEAMQYAICGGGKRIRPVMTIAAAEMCGGDADDAATVALAVECIHNYSLIHDDLPCMDNDDLRRGRPTCHKVYPESIALLAGDGLLNMAFEILSDKDIFRKTDTEALLEVARVLSKASGALGMIGGQTVDLESEARNDVTLDELIYLHERKTGALIRAAAVCGCICAKNGENNAEISNIIPVLDEFSAKLGLAFQIKDDILDVEGIEEVLGKPIGSDEESGKTTFVTLMGIDAAKEYLKKLTEEAKTAIGTLGEKARFFEELADYLLDRTY